MDWQQKMCLIRSGRWMDGWMDVCGQVATALHCTTPPTDVFPWKG